MKSFRVVAMPLFFVCALIAAACAPTPGGGSGGSNNLAPIAVASVNQASGQAPLLVQFSPAGSADPDGFLEAYSWNFGDGTPLSDAPSPAHTYNSGGVFTATLTVSDDGGRTASSVVVVTVIPPDNFPPVAVIGASALSGKTPLTVNFSAAGSTDPDGSIVGYAWSFGDGSLATSATASYTYLVPGNYVVTLSVRDNNGAITTESTSVAIANNLPPIANAVASSSSGKAPLAVSFDGGGSTDDDGNVVSWDWNFDDGNTNTGEVAVHAFTAVGTYQVELTATDDNGDTDTTTVTVQVNAPVPPVAVANATPDGTKAPLGVLFSSAGSIDNDGSILGYSWDFDDGSALSTSVNPSHLFTAAGTFEVTLTVTDDDFLTTSATLTVVVGPPNVPPVAAGSATPAVGKPVLNVSFSSAATSDSDGGIVSYLWNFGDGSDTSTEANPTHSYPDLGSYSVLLTVTDNDGASNTRAIPVTVIPNVAPTAQPVATPRIGKEPLTVALNGSTSNDSDGSIVSYAWDFTTDGEIDSTNVSASYDYVLPGTYTASLTVTDEDGVSDTGTVVITVNNNQAPTAVANANFQSGNAPLSLIFEGRDSLDAEPEGILTYSWDFGDGTATSSSSNPAHVFQEIGNYTVVLTVTDDNGASDTDSVEITALDPVVRAGISGSDVTGDGTLGAPYASIQAAITGAVAQGKTIVKVAGGSYSGFTAASGVSVLGGFDQDFIYGGTNGATAVSVTAASGATALTASGLALPITIKDLSLQGGGGSNATAALVIASTVTFDGVSANSGLASGDGSSAYGIRALDNASVTVLRSAITARSGVAGSAGAAGTAGVGGVNGGNGSTGNGSGGAALNIATPAVRTGGNGGNGVKCVFVIFFCASALPGNPGIGGGLNDPRGGNQGSGGSDANGGGAGAAAGVAAPVAAAGSAGLVVSGDTYSAGVGGTGGVSLAGAGGGGGGSGGSNGNNSSGGGGAGGTGGTAGTGGAGGSGGGGSFAVYSRNSSATIADTALTTGTGGTGGNGGAGGNGANGGNGGAGANTSTPGAGGGGSGGGGGNGGAGGAGGNGGHSVGAYHSGTGTQTADVDALAAVASIGNAGVVGTGGGSGSVGTGGTGGAGGTNGTVAKQGGPGGGGPVGVAGSSGNAGTNLRRVVFDEGVVVNATPIAVAAASKTTGIAPETVDFSSNGSYDPEDVLAIFSWNFGDDSALSTQANPSHTYTSAGTYTAVLTVTDSDGANASASTAAIEIAANQLPVAVANGTPVSGKAPIVVDFSSAGSADGDGSIVSYLWNFGDGSPTSTSSEPSHTYSAQDTYTATLTVTDNKGGVGSASVTVTVSPNNVAPEVAITATPTFGKAPVAVAFTSTVSDADGTVSSIEWNFGDGSPTSTEANPSHTYAVGVWTATLTATDNDGATTTRSVQVRSLPNIAPVASAAATPSTGRAPLITQLGSAGSIDFDGNISSYSWDFGDGSPVSALANPTHTYDAGTFTATVTVTDNEGATATATIGISSTVNQAPVAVANGTPTGTKAPLIVDFSSGGSADGDGTISGYSWNFGDDSAVSTAANPSHTYTVQGTYSATLTVTDNEGGTDVKAVSVTVGAPNVAPVPDGSGTPTSGRAPLEVALTSAGSADSDGTIVAYAWDFGDGSPVENTVTASHTYAAGTWTATLTVTDDDGATAMQAFTISSTVNIAPTATASAIPSSGVAPLAVTLSSAGSDDPDGTIAAYNWDFGDGSEPSSDSNPSHTYTAGTYLATLTVTDNEGGTDTDTVLIRSNVAPVAIASADVTSGDAALAVSFSGSSSGDPDGTVSSYSWNFGDGSPTSNVADPTHTYGPGIFTATLTVTDNEGATSTATVTIDANDPPTASVSSNISSGDGPLTVSFTGDVNDNDGSFGFSWDFGDGSAAVTDDLAPTHIFNNSGTNTVTLTVTDDRGSVATATRTITVNNAAG